MYNYIEKRGGYGVNFIWRKDKNNIKKKNMTIGELAEKQGKQDKIFQINFQEIIFQKKKLENLQNILECEFDFYFIIKDTNEKV